MSVPRSIQLLARLVHAEAGSRIVEVTAVQGAERLGRALGEAATAEDAEDRALQRLMARLDNSEGSPAAAPSLPGVPMARNLEKESPPRHQDREPIRPREISAPLPPLPRSAAEDGSEGPSPLSQAGSQRPAAMGQPLPDRGPRPAVGAVKAASQASPAPPAAAAEPPDDPEDWSGELAGLDLQLRRLGWDRDQEASFLQRAFGHPSRSRLTTYADLKAYLGALEGLPPAADPASAPVPLRRRDLLAQSDQLLGQLGWKAEQARQFLEGQLGASSRQQLNDSQLLQFNMLLESEVITGSQGDGRMAIPPAPAP